MQRAAQTPVKPAPLHQALPQRLCHNVTMKKTIVKTTSVVPPQKQSLQDKNVPTPIKVKRLIHPARQQVETPTAMNALLTLQEELKMFVRKTKKVKIRETLKNILNHDAVEKSMTMQKL